MEKIRRLRHVTHLGDICSKTQQARKPQNMYLHHESLSGYITNIQMANERTFLAWLRTSLSLVTIGIGIVQLLKLKNESEDLSRYAKPLGASFVFIGIMTLVMGTLRYFRVQTMLLSSYYPASQFLVTFLVGTVFLLVVVTLGLLFLA